VKYSAYGVGSYDSQIQYFPYVEMLNLTVEKIPYNIEAAAAEAVGSNPALSIFINLVNYGIKLSYFLLVVRQKPWQCQCYILLLVRPGCMLPGSLHDSPDRTLILT
jgi:hypothetical protein